MSRTKGEDAPPEPRTVDIPTPVGLETERQLEADPELCDPEQRFATGTVSENVPVEVALEVGERFRRDLADLEKAFDRALGSMTMSFQPIVAARDHRLFGYEALLRPNEPELPHPGAMVGAAERLNRVAKLSRAIRSRVAQTCRRAEPERGLFFVNLHALDLLDRALTSRYSPLAKICDRIVLEVTERASLDGLSDLRYRVAELREMGYRIAIDDLGAGHSRMKQFSPLDTDFVKLDMSLVRDIDKHPGKQQLVTSIGSLCRDQGIRVIGEGVETEAERQTLLELECDLLQGYLIARPSPELVDVPPVTS